MSTVSTLASERPSTTILCKFFASGYCWRGETCFFRHRFEATEQGTSLASASSRGKGKGKDVIPSSSASSLKHTVSRSTASASIITPPSIVSPVTVTKEEEQTCTICYEVPNRYGILPACVHVFCFDCIHSWRSTKEKTPIQIMEGILKKCPVCRQESDLVYPSKVWYPEGMLKDDAVRSYRDRLSQIPCKYLQNPRRHCPFGLSCHYSHVDPRTGQTIQFTHTYEETLLRASRRRSSRQYGSVVSALFGLQNAMDRIEETELQRLTREVLEEIVGSGILGGEGGIAAGDGWGDNRRGRGRHNRFGNSQRDEEEILRRERASRRAIAEMAGEIDEANFAFDVRTDWSINGDDEDEDEDISWGIDEDFDRGVWGTW